MDIKYSYYISSKGFKVVGGTAAQFLKADGSQDNNTYLTTNTSQNVTAIKSFITGGGSGIANHTLRAYSTDGSKAGIVLYTGGVGAGIMNYNTAGEFEFKTSDDLGYKSIRAANFIKNGYDDNSFLTAGGGSVLRSSYALTSHGHAFDSLTGKPTTLGGYGITDGINYNDTLMPTNPFGGKQLFINSIDNAMYAADKKWDVKVTLHMKIHNSESYPKANPDWVDQYSLSTTDNKTFTLTNNVAKPPQIVVYSGTTLCSIASSPVGAFQFTYDSISGTIVFGAVATSVQVYPEYNTPKELDSPIVQTLNASLPFNGNYENGVIAGSEHYMKVRITPKSTGITAFNQIIGYPYGSLYLSYYATLTPDKSDLRVFNRDYQQHGVGWKKLNFTDYSGNNANSGNIQIATDNLDYGRSVMEIIIYGHNNHNTQLSQIDWKLTRPELSSTGATVTKFGINKLYYDLRFGDAESNKVVISPLGNVTAEKFVKTAGTAAQFLKADGSIDTNSYLAQATLNTQLANYVTLNGVQTFTNTKTFTTSPVIPAGTLETHAVNRKQVYDNFISAPGGFSNLMYNQDFNNLKNTGFFRGEQFTNAPENSVGWFYVQIEGHDNQWTKQTATSYGVGLEANRTFQRVCNNNLWTNWLEITAKGIFKNKVFSEASGLELMMSDKNFDEESGLVDAAYEAIVAGEENGFWKFGSNIGGINGIIIEKNTRRIGYGGVQPSGIYEHNFADRVFVNGSITSAGGFIHNDYNSPDKVLTSDGGVVDRTEFGGTTVKYIEVEPGDSFTPTRGAHFNVYIKDYGKIYLDSTGFDDGQIITTFNKSSGSTQIYIGVTLRLTISGNKSNKFMKTSDGWLRIDEFGNTTII